MDALEIHDFFVLSRSVGILLTASPDLREPGTRSAWGTGSDVTLDTVQYGIVAAATTQPGIEIYECTSAGGARSRASRGPIEIWRNQSARLGHHRWLGAGNVGVGRVPGALGGSSDRT